MSDKQNIKELRTDLANLLINRISLSESLQLIQSKCIETANQMIEEADDEKLHQIRRDVWKFKRGINGDDEEKTPAPDPSGPSTSGEAGSSK